MLLVVRRVATGEIVRVYFGYRLMCGKERLVFEPLQEKNWQPQSWDRVYSRHFVSGWPSDFIEDVDYRPTQLMKGEVQVQCSDTPRSQRAKERCTAAHMREVAMVRYYFG